MQVKKHFLYFWATIFLTIFAIFCVVLNTGKCVLASSAPEVSLSTSATNPITNPTYLNVVSFGGTKSAGSEVYINDATKNISYSSVTDWQATENLKLGNNSFLIYAQNQAGEKSGSVILTVFRLTAGDVTGDGVINDIDLAKLISAWGKKLTGTGDFNGDGIIDDIDLAILLSHWTK